MIERLSGKTGNCEAQAQMWLPALQSELMAIANFCGNSSRSLATTVCLPKLLSLKAILFEGARGALRCLAIVLPPTASRKRNRKESSEAQSAEDFLFDEVSPFRDLIEHSADGTALLEEGGAIIYASPSMSRVLGKFPGSLIGRKIHDFVHPEDVRQVSDNLDGILEGAGDRWTTEMRCVRPNGHWAWIECTATNLLANPNVRAIVVSCRDIDERKRAEEKWRSLAVTDPLTGLKNYRGLIEAFEYELQRSSRTHRPFAVLLMDLDGLKKINDTLGHLAGNQAICTVANAMRGVCRAMDTAARYGGDEFAMVLPESESEAAGVIAARIEQHLSEGEETQRVSLSIGITSYPIDGVTAEALLNTADERLYEQKTSRRARSSLR